jgi:sterol desaturase/sphingolipid hydroxylase (fatty acid hydroxylase superfamily)
MPLDALPILFPIGFVIALVLERVIPGRALPRVKGWVLKGTIFFLVALVLRGPLAGALAAMTAPYALVDLRTHPLLAFFALVLGGGVLDYFTHRLMHRVHFLWRAMHQLHHSAERVDVAGFTFAHPAETMIAVVQGIAVSTIFGASPLVAFIAGYFGFATAVLTHLNVKTPRFLGFIVQRPEQHSLHHERGLHAYNYGLPIFDFLFGTYRNPAQFSAETGFYAGASRRMLDMFLARDVATPSSADGDEGEAVRGQRDAQPARAA